MKNNNHPWFRSRGYAHFDRPLSISRAEALVSDPKAVASHSFFPFLRYTVTSQKIAKDLLTGRAKKKAPKLRPISYAAHSDSHIYSYYAKKLSEDYERSLKKAALDEVVLAFRALGKSNVNFANEAFEAINRYGECCVFATDITGFFDNIDHRHMKKAWSDVLSVAQLPDDHYAVFKSLTRYAHAERDAVFSALGVSENNPPIAPNRICSTSQFRDVVRKSGLLVRNNSNRGIPQGSPISALLSNIFLFDFDRRLNSHIQQLNGRYVRYCDDILCIIPVDCEPGFFEFVNQLIGEYSLEINKSKTEICLFHRTAIGLQTSRPLQYLGFTFDGQRKLIRSAAFARFSEKVRRGVSLAKQTARKRNKIRGVSENLYRKKLYENYSHMGRRNFVTYALGASRLMDSVHMRRQLKPLWRYLHKRIDAADSEL